MKKTKWLVLMLVLAGLLGLPTVSRAASSSFSQVAKFTTNSITIEWIDMTEKVSTPSLPATIVAYRVALYDEEGNDCGQSKALSSKIRKYTIANGEGLSSDLFRNIRPNCNYQVELITYFKTRKTAEGKVNAGKLLKTGFFTLPGATEITSFNHRSNQKGLLVTWDPVEGNNPVKYQYQIYSYKGKKLSSGIKATNYIKTSSFKCYNTACRIRVRAFYTDDNGKNYPGAWSAYTNIVPQPVMTSGKCKSNSKYRVGIQSNGTMILEWKRVLGATKYDIYISTKKGNAGSYTYRGSVNTVSSREYYPTSVDTFKGKPFAKNKNYYVYIKAVTNKLGESKVNYTIRYALKTSN